MKTKEHLLELLLQAHSELARLTAENKSLRDQLELLRSLYTTNRIPEIIVNNDNRSQ